MNHFLSKREGQHLGVSLRCCQCGNEDEAGVWVWRGGVCGEKWPVMLQGSKGAESNLSDCAVACRAPVVLASAVPVVTPPP